MGRFKFVKNLIVTISMVLPLFGFAQDYPRFELYQLVQGADSGQFIVTDSDSNLVFSDLLKLRYSPDTALIFNGDTIAVKTEVSFPTFLAGLGITIEFDSDLNQYYIQSLAIEDSVFNNSFSDIPKGTPLYAVGGQGRDYWSVDVADASDPNKMPVIGIAEDLLPARDWGKLLIKGHITDVPTIGLDEGAEVYVAAGGGYTDEIPKGENVIIQRLGTVIKGNKNNGSGIINLGDPVTAPNLNPDRIFIGDVDSNVTRINLYTAIKDTASVLVSDSLTNYASKTELADTALAIRSDIPTGAITGTNKGNNRIPTFEGNNNIIDGLNNYWINNFGEMVDNLSDGTAPNPVGYKFKTNSKLFADSIESNVIETASGGKANLNSLTTTGTTIFSGTIGGNNTTVLSSGQIGINETPSGNLSLTTYWGALFNNDQYNGVNGDFTVRSANQSSMFFIDSDLDAIGIGGATPNSNFDVNINGGVQINSSGSGGIYDGLIVQGDTDPALFKVNADTDKVGISEALPQWTLDVDGDINFNGDLYQNDALVTFGGEEYVFNIILNASKASAYVNLPPTVYGCTIDEIGMVMDVIGCTSCSFDYNLGAISGGSFGTNVNLWNPSFTTGSGQDGSVQTFTQTIGITNNVIQVLNTGITTLPYFNASVIVSCN